MSYTNKLKKQGLDYVAFSAWLKRNHTITIGTLSEVELKPYIKEYKQMRKIRNTHLKTNFKFCSVCKEKMLKKHFYSDGKRLRSECKSCLQEKDYKVDVVKKKASHVRSEQRFKEKYGVKRDNLSRYISYWYDVRLGSLDHGERKLYVKEYRKHLKAKG